jgi:hypothetical protein
MESFHNQWKIKTEDFDAHGEITEFYYKDYKCSIERCRGHWCGYVFMTGKTKRDDYDRFGHYNVHGGITCIVQIDDKIKIGFDCAHVYDFSETDENGQFYFDRGQIFRTFDYVQQELQNIVDEIISENIYKP